MVLTEQGKQFLDNISLYKGYGLNTIVNISGTELLKGNKILPVSTIYLESNDGNILFVADYCSKKETKQLIDKISEALDIRQIKEFIIKENEGPERDQEMITYIAYADPDIRPVLFSGETEINNNKVNIADNKILLNEEEAKPQVFLAKLFSPDDSVETKVKLEEELEKRKTSLLDIVEQLLAISAALHNETVIPKVIDIDGVLIDAIVFKDEFGKYKAMTITDNKPEIISKFAIKKDSSWEKIADNVANSDYMNNKKDELIERLMGGFELND